MLYNYTYVYILLYNCAILCTMILFRFTTYYLRSSNIIYIIYNITLHSIPSLYINVLKYRPYLSILWEKKHHGLIPKRMQKKTGHQRYLFMHRYTLYYEHYTMYNIIITIFANNGTMSGLIWSRIIMINATFMLQRVYIYMYMYTCMHSMCIYIYV